MKSSEQINFRLGTALVLDIALLQSQLAFPFTKCKKTLSAINEYDCVFVKIGATLALLLWFVMPSTLLP